MKIVAQWKNYHWVNFYDEHGNARYFETIGEAKEFLRTGHVSRDVDVRICEYLGGRKYKELESPKPLSTYSV